PSSLPEWSSYSPEGLYHLGDQPDYEPGPEKSLAAIAAAANREPFEMLYDLLLEDGGRTLWMRPALNYSDGSLQPAYEMLTDPWPVVGGSDGGAHCGAICDASAPTSLLTHWVRDRSRGPRLALEDAVRLQTSATADFFGLSDRGRIAVGAKADLNV